MSKSIFAHMLNALCYQSVFNYKSFLVMSGLNMSRVRILAMWAEGC